MFGKGTKLYSIFRHRCPRCHEGKVFVEANPYNLTKLTQMHEKCDQCGLKYEIENGFFYGSMYVAYALTVAVSVAVFVAYFTFAEVDVTTYLLLNAGVLIVSMPLLFRLARMIWLNIFIAYKRDAKKTNPSD